MERAFVYEALAFNYSVFPTVHSPNKVRQKDCQEPWTGRDDTPSPSVKFKDGRYEQRLRARQPETLLCQGCLKTVVVLLEL